MRPIAPFTCALIALALALSAPVGAQTHAPTPSQTVAMEAVANFRLTDSFLKRDLAYTLDGSRDPCRYAFLPLLGKLQNGHASLDQIAAEYDARPGVHAMLAKHGLTAREALVGGLAMLSASISVMTPEARRLGATISQSGPQTPTTRANIAFYKAHLPEINAFHARLSAVASQRVRQGGMRLATKDLACMQASAR